MEAFADGGVEVDGPANGPTASAIVEHAKRFEPRCVLLDISLGEEVGSGIDLIDPMLAIGANVIMLTAETRRTVLAACLEQGAAGWIGKNTFLDEVVGTLNDVLAGKPLIGQTIRETMIDELRIERASQQRALSPFERLTMRERAVLAALVATWVGLAVTRTAVQSARRQRATVVADGAR